MNKGINAFINRESLKAGYYDLAARILLILILLPAHSETFSQNTHPSHFVPMEKKVSTDWVKKLWDDNRKIYKGEELKTIGMPCGGIAAGQLYVRGDGTLANWWIANNAFNTGYGIDHLMNFNTALGPWKVCYQTFEPFSYIDQGFSVTIKGNNTSYFKNLSKSDFDDISFIGEYPIAFINYASKEDPLPVNIQAEIFSPFIPLNARESATPGTILKYRIENTSGHSLSVNLTGWLQNLVCLELKDEILARSRNKVVQNAGFVSVSMDLAEEKSRHEVQKRKWIVFDDFESGAFSKWKARGAAFGNGPVDQALPSQQPVTGYEGKYYVNSYHGGDEPVGELISVPFKIENDYIHFMIGGGNHKDKSCFNLVVDGKVVKTETGGNYERLEYRTWNVREYVNQTAHFEIIDKATGGWGHINIDQILFSDFPEIMEKYFPSSHPYFGNVSLSVLDDNGYSDADFTGKNDEEANGSAERKTGDKLLGAVGLNMELAPGESRETVFLLTWYFPNRPMNYGDGGNWNKPIPTHGEAIGNMYANWFNHSQDVAGYLYRNLDRLTAETFKFHNSYYKETTLPYWLKQRIMMPVSNLATETCQWWATDKFWAWEGVGSCVGTCTHVWNYEHALARLFPELERNIREKTDFGTSFRDDGAIYARNGWGGILIDGHAGGILKAYREHLLSKDGLFLSRNWQKIKKAVEYLISEDGDSDGLIEKSQSNTYDIAFYGANTYVGGLYLAALKAAVEMAQIMNDTSFVNHCNRIYQSGKDLTVEKLWNGEYFVQDVDLAKHPRFQYADGCLSDQLLGQTWAHLNRLGYIYPEENIRQSLESIWKYNWTTDVGLQNKNHPPERVFADPGEPGLFICTWPKSPHPGEDGVRYRDEVWTGIEYQVAANMIYEGMIEKGLSIVQAIHQRYSPEKHNPWNEVECGDHYARALASWGVIIALEDYYYNGPEGILSFAPKVQEDDFNGFFTAAEAWGNLEQKRAHGGQTNIIKVDYGRLFLNSVEVDIVNKPGKATAFINNKEVAIDCLTNGNTLQVNFREPVELNENESLRLEIELSV